MFLQGKAGYDFSDPLAAEPERAIAMPQCAGEDPDFYGNSACEYMPRVSAFHDGELTHEDTLLLSDHFDRCEACRESLAFLQRVSRRFAAADPRALLRATPRHAQPIRKRQRSLRPPADVRWARRLTAIAAALFVAASGRVVYIQYNTASSLGRSARPLDHRVNQIIPNQASPAQPAAFSGTQRSSAH